MSLKEYLEKNKEIKIIYGLQSKYSNDFVKMQLKVRNKNKLVKQLQDLIFRKKKIKGIYLFSSKKVPYILYGDEFPAVDILVLSLDKKKGLKAFGNEIKKSEKIRKEKINFLMNKFKPFLRKLMKTEYVLASIGRGDIFDKNRLPNKYSDIDIVLITNFRSHSWTKKRELINHLKKSPVTTAVDYYIFFKKGGFSGHSKLLINRNVKYNIEFSIISYPDFTRLYKIWKKKGIKIRRYDVNTFSNAKIIFQKNNIGKEFLRKYLSLAP